MSDKTLAETNAEVEVKAEAPVTDTKAEEPKNEKKESKKEKVAAAPAPAPVEDKKATLSGLEVGDTVRLKESVKQDMLGRDIPEFAYRNEYNVYKILEDRILIKAGLKFILPVLEKDVEKKVGGDN